MRSVTTVLANKSVLLPCSDGIAMRTGLRRIARVNEDHFDTRSTSFVHYLLLKLPEGPAVQACANLLPGLDSLADVRKIFKNDQANIGLFRLFGETGSSMVPWSRSELAREKDAAKFPS